MRRPLGRRGCAQDQAEGGSSKGGVRSEPGGASEVIRMISLCRMRRAEGTIVSEETSPMRWT